MSQNNIKSTEARKSRAVWVFAGLVVIGLLSFIYGAAGQHPTRAWQAYLINFLLWSGIAQGAVVFSAVMHITKARWSGPLSGLAESFAVFFPLSFILFLLLFLGQTHIFPWLNEDLHGKEAWLNMPFLFTRDCFGLLILYGLGLVYLYYSLRLKFDSSQSRGWLRALLRNRWSRREQDPASLKSKLAFLGGFYILAFALVLCLIGYDLVMSMDPHWISTLFGAYTFVKAFYVGLGAIIILAAVIYLKHGPDSGLTTAHFHDIGKLFFAFCLLWADFFYVQLVVIWYGNIPEEAHYVIKRVMLPPWNSLAWAVFFVCFIIPFFVLLNKKIKTKPVFMIVICSVIIIGIWFEHLLLLGPALSHNLTDIPLSFSDGLISIGFLGLLGLVVTCFLNTFPEIAAVKQPDN
ncbi:MAG: hypothetical protein JSU83_08400 [Deltaproteobacteria bacterium]|nr:MAG: hypothetical protein JSU83_08400 [Deltaproteobacteria bacterium]